MTTEWFTLEDIQPVETDDTLYCISVDSPTKQFLIGETHVPTHNTDEGKAEDELRGEAAMIIGSITRLGRAAGVHLIIATQRPDATIIAGETKSNLSVRINCGRTNSTASSMILDNAEGTRVKSSPKGRLYLGIHGVGDHGQGFFAEQEWIEEFLAKQGLNPDGTPLADQPRSEFVPMTDFAEFEDADLDTQNGIDNSSPRQQPVEQYTPEASEASAVDEDVAKDPEDMTAGEKAGLILGQGNEEDQFHRPEEDWDDELEALIRQNNA